MIQCAKILLVCASDIQIELPLNDSSNFSELHLICNEEKACESRLGEKIEIHTIKCISDAQSSKTEE